MSWFKRTTSAKQSHPRRPGPSTNGSPQAVSTRNTQANNQSVHRHQDTTASIGWSSYPSGPAQGTGPAYPTHAGHSQQGNSHHLGGYSHPDDNAYAGGSRQPSNLTSPRVANRPTVRTNSLSLHPPPIISRNECRDLFNAVDQNRDGVLNLEELHSALFNTGGSRFSADTVKYLVSTFDLDGNGVIAFEEFEALWNYLKEWQQMFDSFDNDRNGRIDATELVNALEHYRIRVSSRVIDMVIRKYAVMSTWNQQPGYGGVPAGPQVAQMDLDHFVCACVVVREMCRLYAQCSAGGRPQISRDDFFQAVISLP